MKSRGLLALASFLAGISLLLVSHASGQENDALCAGIGKIASKKKYAIGPTTPGVAVAIRQPGKLEFMAGYGLANLPNKTPITPATRFELASLSKPFTALAIMILEGQGKLNLDDPIGTYLPELPKGAGKKIQITDLLHHTSGLPDYLALEEVPRAHKDFWTNEDYVPEFAKQWKKFPPLFEPRAKFAYSNTNFMLLATIVARVAKEPYPAFMRDNVFKPAGMKHTFVYARPVEPPKHPTEGHACAVGYGHPKGSTEWKVSWGVVPDSKEELLTFGDGAIWTSVEDLLAFDAALRKGTLLPKKQFDRMLEKLKTKDGKLSEHGIGWYVADDETGKPATFEHSGNWGDFNTNFVRYLKDDLTMIVLSNRGGFDPGAFTESIRPLVDQAIKGK